MTEVENLVLEHLRHVRGAVDEIRLDVREMKTRVGILEQQYASVSTRIGRIEDRLDRIENRLGLVEAYPRAIFSASLRACSAAWQRISPRFSDL